MESALQHRLSWPTIMRGLCDVLHHIFSVYPYILMVKVVFTYCAVIYFCFEMVKAVSNDCFVPSTNKLVFWSFL